MESESDFTKKIVQSMGTTMMVAWLLTLGPVGALLLGAVAYTILAQNPLQGVFCGVLLFLPLCLTITWGIGMWLQTRRKKRLARPAIRLTTEPIHSTFVN
ncbi:MAG: hypothetical protein WBG50_00835 [Desulfomonilaceae bacterium]